MMENTPLSEAIREYEILKSRKSAAADALKEATTKAADAEQMVIAMLLDAADASGLDDMRAIVDGRSYTVQQKDYYNIAAADRAEVFPRLRELGMGHLIQEKVDDRTLTNELRSIRDDNGGELPDHLAALPLKTYTKTTLSSRKA